MTGRPATTVVVPTLGRPSLSALCGALARQTVRVEAPVLLLDDRRAPADGLLHQLTGDDRIDVRVVPAGGLGPAHARNLGWRLARTRWVSFLDDDVLPDDDWYARLLADLERADRAEAVGTTGRVRVPLPRDRRPTDWERGTAGLEVARWITADLSYLRDRLADVGGFDERFPRAFREDADLALRLGADRGTVVEGTRRVTHPVRRTDDWVSVRQQAGNADDRLMRRVHGAGWHHRAQAPAGRLPGHVAITAAAAVALAGLVARRRWVAALGLLGWLVGTGELAWARIAPGPRDRAEVRRMVLSSAAIPVAASWHTAVGTLRHRDAAPWRGIPELVLLDRDGTLVHDVPYNGDPALVRPVAGARPALDRLRAEGVRLAVVTNQSGVASGRITRAQVDAVNTRVEELLGPFDGVYVCPHAPAEGCGCRKPAPGMVEQACADLGVEPSRCVLVGDVVADVEAAVAGGAVGILVPTSDTRPAEVEAAPRVAGSLPDALARVLEGDW